MASFISHKYKLIFCHIPRTGGTSFYQAIKPYLDDPGIDIEKHTPLSVFQQGRIGEEWFHDYFKVTIIRDEIDRFVSLRNNVDRPVDLTDMYWWPVYMWIFDRYGNNLLDWAIDFAKLPYSGIEVMRELLGITGEINFPHLNERKEVSHEQAERDGDQGRRQFEEGGRLPGMV